LGRVAVYGKFGTYRSVIAGLNRPKKTNAGQMAGVREGGRRGGEGLAVTARKDAEERFDVLVGSKVAIAVEV
jgi:hypothetical protein